MRNFPRPISLGENCSRWRLSQLESYERRAAGNADEERPLSEEIYLSDIQVAARYNVARNTVWRWARRSGEGVAA